MHAIHDAMFPSTASRIGRWLWLPFAGVLVGSADLVFAAAYWAPQGLPPIRIPQSIAAWILGADVAHAGGWITALAGMVLYFYLTTSMVAGYHVLSRRHAVMLRRPLLAGALYGAAMYVLLFKVAVPLWRGMPAPAEPVAWTIACTLAYMVLIGIPCALFARAYQRPPPSE